MDAVIVNGPHGPQVYTIEGADHPYRVLVEQMPEGTVTLDQSGVILYSNRQFAGLIGKPVESVTGSDFSRYLPTLDSNIFRSLKDAAELRGHSSGEFDIRDHRGVSIPVRVSLTSVELGELKTICVIASDQREQHRNDAILKDEQLSRLILEQAGEAIVVIDPQGSIIRRSESARNFASATMLSNHFDVAFQLSSEGAPLDAERILSAVRAGHVIRGVEASIRVPTGKEWALLVSASPLRGPESELLGCVITLTDITDRKRAEEALARQAEELQQANSDLRQFAHSASHDLREPLRQLAVFSELLQKNYQDKLDPEAVELVQYTVESAHRMEGLLKGLLDYTQATGSNLTPPARSDPNEIVRKTLAMFNNQIAETGARIDWEPLPLLQVHEVHLTQLFQNLIGNALKYRSDAPPLIQISAGCINGMWEIAVADNGIGIPPVYREHVFGLFKRLHGGAKYSGSGIGLAICQKIVQRYGGRIWVEDARERGSRFVFTLPGGPTDARSS